MLTMQAFHTFLFEKVDEHSEYFRNLARLPKLIYPR
jgi:hypothetical protein